MSKTSFAVSASFAIIAFVVGVSFGYFLTPEYRLSMYDKNVMELGTADRWFDLRYLNAMIAHHRAAMLLAEQVQISERAELRDLAQAILTDEPKLIDELYAWKEAWYRDTRRVRDPQVANLGLYNGTFDLRFLNALIAHHDEGILMTRETRFKSARSEILDNADAVEAFLTRTGTVLRTWRNEWYGLE